MSSHVMALLTAALLGAGAPAAAPATPPPATPPPATTPPATTPLAEAPDPRAAVVSQVTGWVAAAGDNGKLPFMVIDKIAAKVFVYDRTGKVLGSTPALLGLALGDHSTPSVGNRELSAIKPKDRTTPAGRFVASFGRAYGRRNVLWVDYSTAISLHPVVTAHPKERRPQRLRSASPADNRITYGCINVAPAFYEKVVRKVFRKSGGIVYVLPETKQLNEAFPSFRIQASAAEAGLSAASS